MALCSLCVGCTLGLHVFLIGTGMFHVIRLPTESQTIANSYITFIYFYLKLLIHRAGFCCRLVLCAVWVVCVSITAHGLVKRRTIIRGDRQAMLEPKHQIRVGNVMSPNRHQHLFVRVNLAGCNCGRFVIEAPGQNDRRLATTPDLDQRVVAAREAVVGCIRRVAARAAFDQMKIRQAEIFKLGDDMLELRDWGLGSVVLLKRPGR